MGLDLLYTRGKAHPLIAVQTQISRICIGAVLFSFLSFTSAAAAERVVIASLSPGQPGFADVVHYGVPRPEFPTIDTSEFQQYVPVVGSTGPSVDHQQPRSSASAARWSRRSRCGAAPSR